MSKKIKKATAALLTANSRVTADLSLACWLLINPVEGISEKPVEIGRSDHSKVPQALSWASDDYRFNLYNGPGTDFPKEVHVYSRVGENPYTEDGATLKVDGVWHKADVIQLNGVLRFENVVPLDPVDHSGEKILRMQEFGATLERQKAAQEQERNRALGDRLRAEKHSWGIFHGYPFKVWIAHTRNLADHYCHMINMADDEQAEELRTKNIGQAIDFQRFIAPVRREAAQSVATEPTDSPDFEPPSKKEIEPILMKGVNINTRALLPEPVDITALEAGTWLVFFLNGRNLRELNYQLQWQPDNNRVVAELKRFAATGSYAIGVR